MNKLMTCGAKVGDEWPKRRCWMSMEADLAILCGKLIGNNPVGVKFT